MFKHPNKKISPILAFGVILIVSLSLALAIPIFYFDSFIYEENNISVMMNKKSPSSDSIKVTLKLIEEQNDRYSIHAEYPHTGLKPIDGPVIDFINQKVADIKKAEQDFRNDPGLSAGAPNWKFELSTSYADIRFPPKYLSYKIEAYQYFGGAHGSTQIKTFVFNVKDGSQVALSDIFSGQTDYLNNISRICASRLAAAINPPDDFSKNWIAEGTAPKPENYGAFILTPNSIIFYFPQYQVAAYAYGIQQVEISYSDLGIFPESAGTADMMDAFLYYYNPEKDKDASGNILCSRKGLMPVKRALPKIIGAPPIKDAINLLLKGELTPEEKSRGITTEFPLAGVSLKGVALKNGEIILEFNDPQNKTGGGSWRTGILWFQIEATAKQFSSANDKVVFSPDSLFQP